jgi:hypothetical protein
MTINLNELIYLLKSDYVERYNPFLCYFQNLPAWNHGSEDYIKKLCEYVQVRNPVRFEKTRDKRLEKQGQI